tara:strand:+ start:369 stop:992 length:624 start_codon:yes stop_codon:yes gene_type:complete
MLEKKQDRFIESAGYDPMMRPPPGHSLTLPPGNQPYEQPPKFSKSSDFIEHIFDKFQIPENEAELMNSLAVGISLQEIVQAIGLGAFTTGLANPDVVENSKPEIFVNLLSQAMDLFDIQEDSPIPFKLFATPSGLAEEEQTMDDLTAIQMAKKRNPRGYAVFEENQKAEQQERDMQMVEQMAQDLDQYKTETKKSGGFLDVESPEEA